MSLTINPDGTVKKVEIVSGGINSKIKKCVIGQVKKWLFPKPVNGQAVKVTIILS